MSECSCTGKNRREEIKMTLERKEKSIAFWMYS